MRMTGQMRLGLVLLVFATGLGALEVTANRTAGGGPIDASSAIAVTADASPPSSRGTTMPLTQATSSAPQVVVQPLPTPMVKPRSHAKPHPHPAAKPHPHPATKPHPHPAAKPHPHPAAKPHPHPAAKPHPHSAAKPHPHPAVKPHPHPAVKPHPHPAVKPHPHPAAKPTPSVRRPPVRRTPAPHAVVVVPLPPRRAALATSATARPAVADDPQSYRRAAEVDAMERYVLAYLKATDPTFLVLSSRARSLGGSSATVTAHAFTASHTVFTTIVVARDLGGFRVISRQDAIVGPPPSGLQGRGATAPVTPAPRNARGRSFDG